MRPTLPQRSEASTGTVWSIVVASAFFACASCGVSPQSFEDAEVGPIYRAPCDTSVERLEWDSLVGAYGWTTGELVALVPEVGECSIGDHRLSFVVSAFTALDYDPSVFLHDETYREGECVQVLSTNVQVELMSTTLGSPEIHSCGLQVNLAVSPVAVDIDCSLNDAGSEAVPSLDGDDYARTVWLLGTVDLDAPDQSTMGVWIRGDDGRVELDCG